MISTMGKLLDAWYALLNGAISYGGSAVPVYKEDVDEDLDGHYIVITAEGETDQSNKTSFVNDSVVVVDIVTRFNNNVDRSVVEDIDGQIGALILTRPNQSNLAAQTGMQILQVKRETSNYITERDSNDKYYRKVSRYNHRITQTN